MKICKKCNVEKGNYEFSKNKNKPDGFQPYCKSCKKVIDNKRLKENPSIFKKYNRDKYIILKEILSKLKIDKGGKCNKCLDEREYLLDFHHLNPEIKVSTISRIIGNYGHKSYDKAKKEADKCILLCSNCHREFHYLERENNIKIEEYISRS